MLNWSMPCVYLVQDLKVKLQMCQKGAVIGKQCLEDQYLLVHIQNWTWVCQSLTILWCKQSRQDRDPLPTCSRLSGKFFEHKHQWHWAKATQSPQLLRSIVSSDGSLDMEVVAQISKASQSLGCPMLSCDRSSNFKLWTNMKVYKAVILTNLLYGCECGCFTGNTSTSLSVCTCGLCNHLMASNGRYSVTTVEVLDKGSLVSIELQYNTSAPARDNKNLLAHLYSSEYDSFDLGMSRKWYTDCINDRREEGQDKA